MTFLLVLAITIVACFVLREPIRRWPWIFYVLALAVDVAFLAASYGLLSRDIWLVLYKPMQKASIALALFAVVMYIGVFPLDSKVSHWLRPIRAQLSIIACLLIAGHMAMFLGSYVIRLFNGSVMKPNVLASFLIAVLLLVLVVLLGVTSFKAVKRHMSPKTWKNIQRWAYPFFALAYAHVLLMLLPAAARGGAHAKESIIVYSVVFGVYLVARIVRAVLDRKAGRTQPELEDFAAQ